jgi:hypothetical protein
MQIITPELFEMTYSDLCNHYLAKYGNAKYDYFSTPECKSVQKKNSRTNEGLEIHHIDENRYPMLSASWAKNMPFECQKAYRLVYVNVLEHLLLHIKIYEEQCLKCISTGKTAILGQPGIYMISNRINDYFSNEIQLKGWHENMKKTIIDNYDDYKNELVYYLRYFLKFHFDRPELLSKEISCVSRKSNGKNDEKLKLVLRRKISEFSSYHIGDQVIHDTFGKGTITNYEKKGKSLILEVDFEKCGKKKIIYSHLRKKNE